MKTTSRTRKARKTNPRVAIGKLTIREIVESKRGYSWTTYLVQGWRKADGRHGRKRFKTRKEAEAFIATKNVELANSDTALHNVVTRISKAQVEAAEGAYARLGNRYSLGEAVDYFVRNFAQPDNPVPLDKARDSFLETRECEGVRPRSLVQLRSTLKQFLGFVTLRLLPAELQPEIERVRWEIGRERAATPEEIVKCLPFEWREAGRKASEDADNVPAMLRGKLAPELRDAIAAARDAIESRRQPAVYHIAAGVIARVPGAKVPAVHEIAAADVEAFLRSLRDKAGTGAASRKTWNNARADIHAFLGWCADKQRRWCAENAAAAVAKFKLGRGVPHVLSVKQARELMAYVADYEKGAMVKYFALALFAGLRSAPDGELRKLARHADRAKLIDIARGVIHVQPEISKTHQYRQVTIRPALHQWLTRCDGEIWPTNADRMLKHIRARFELAHDVLRHSFFSYLVGAEKSVERAALEGGNTESILRRHYLNLARADEAENFWRILPPTAEGKNKVVQIMA